jgi:hypothetical protein
MQSFDAYIIGTCMCSSPTAVPQGKHSSIPSKAHKITSRCTGTALAAKDTEIKVAVTMIDGSGIIGLLDATAEGKSDVPRGSTGTAATRVTLSLQWLPTLVAAYPGFGKLSRTCTLNQFESDF